ncbi:MAG TPA: zinc-dependent metalloprotease [Luteibaculaceae bacterium]|nr:zinc-dependent metalloprotease [Luteibaculaceae bacterium]
MKKILLIALALSVSAPGFAQKKRGKKGKKQAEAPAPSADKKKDISGLTKSAKLYKGLFAVYQDTLTGELMLKLEPSQLNKEYIYFSQIADGANASGYFRGSYRGSKIFKVQRYYDQIEFVVENTSYYYDPANPLSKVGKANINKPIVLTEKILAQDSTGILIKANDLFLGEGFNQIKPSSFPGAGNGFNLGSISKERSRVKSIKNYPANTDVVVSVAFSNPYPTNYGDPSVTDARFVNVEIVHNLIEVPNNDYKPRRDDPRLGYFMTQQENMTDLSSKPYHDMIHRWHLVKKDPTAALSEPVEPITWWIENTTPIEFRETIREGVLRWNRVFEKAGFKNAVEVKIQPDDADWDAGDIRYNVLRWTASPYPRFGGYGPSFVNPRTGQILGADVMLEFVYFKNIVSRYDRFDRAGLGAIDVEEHTEFDPTLCQAGAVMQNQLAFGMTSIKAREMSPKDSVDLVRQALIRLVLHEVGHTLGLNHNMKASSVLSPAEIKDKSRLRDGWLSNSIMEYPAINNALRTEDQTLFYDEFCGPYDDWVIEYGYSPSLDSETDEEARLQRILARSSDPMLAFGNDADDMRSNGSGIDPRVNIYDLSSDPVAYGAERITLVNELLAKLKQKYTVSGDNYHNLRMSYMALTGEIATQLRIMTRQVGGVYVDRSFVGTERAGSKPLQPVPYATQKEAMRQLKLHAFGKTAFQEPAELYNFLQLQRRGFNFGGNNEDPQIHNRILAVQADLLDQLLHPTVMLRISDATLYGNQYKLDEFMTDLTKSIFEEDLTGKVTSIRQNLQVRYTADLIEVFKSKFHDNLAKAQALAQLTAIKKQQSAGVSPDASTKAHRAYIVYQINQALENK